MLHNEVIWRLYGFGTDSKFFYIHKYSSCIFEKSLKYYLENKQFVNVNLLILTNF